MRPASRGDNGPLVPCPSRIEGAAAGAFQPGLEESPVTTTPATTIPARTPTAPVLLHDQLAEGGEMQQAPRGGWRFADPLDEAAHGAAAPPPSLVLPRRADPFQAHAPEDETRAGFEGDPQHPAHGYPGGGTWSTWTEAAAYRRAS